MNIFTFLEKISLWLQGRKEIRCTKAEGEVK